MFTLFNQGIMGYEYIQYEFDDNYQVISSHHTYPSEELIPVATKRLVRTIYTSYSARKSDITFNFLKENHYLLRILDLEKTIKCSYLNGDLFTQDELNELIALQKQLSPLPEDPEMEELDRRRKEAFNKSWQGIKKSDITPVIVPMPLFKALSLTKMCGFDGDSSCMFNIFDIDNKEEE